MGGCLHYVPVLGTAVAFLINTLLAIPFYLLWNYLCPIYFSWMPDVWHQIPFWDCVWLFMLVGILRMLVPKFSSSSSSVDKESDD